MKLNKTQLDWFVSRFLILKFNKPMNQTDRFTKFIKYTYKPNILLTSLLNQDEFKNYVSKDFMITMFRRTIEYFKVCLSVQFHRIRI